MQSPTVLASPATGVAEVSVVSVFGFAKTRVLKSNLIRHTSGKSPIQVIKNIIVLSLFRKSSFSTKSDKNINKKMSYTQY